MFFSSFEYFDQNMCAEVQLRRQIHFNSVNINSICENLIVFLCYITSYITSNCHSLLKDPILGGFKSGKPTLYWLSVYYMFTQRTLQTIENAYAKPLTPNPPFFYLHIYTKMCIHFFTLSEICIILKTFFFSLLTLYAHRICQAQWLHCVDLHTAGT